MWESEILRNKFHNSVKKKYSKKKHYGKRLSESQKGMCYSTFVLY